MSGPHPTRTFLMIYEMTDDNKLLPYNNLLDTLHGKKEIKILFICLGNICRSPAAEGVMQRIAASTPSDRKWLIDSAGIGRWHVGDLPDRRMRLHARDRGYDLIHRCRQISTQDFFDFDLIIGMDSMNIEDLKELAPSPETAAKIMPMSAFFSPGTRIDCVPDPYYEGSEGFELVLDLLESSCRNIFDAVENV